MSVTPNRMRVASWVTGAASMGALLAVLASSVVSPSALANPRPGVTTPSQATSLAHDPRNPAQKAYDARMAALRQKFDTAHPVSAALAKMKKLPKSALKASPLGTALPRTNTATTGNAVSPHTAAPVTTSTSLGPLGPAPIAANGVLTSDNVTGVATSASNISDVWISTEYGGVWNSTNGGSTWKPMTDSLGVMTFNSIAVDPTNDQIIYAGGGYPLYYYSPNIGSGVFKSTDGGATWTQLGSLSFGYGPILHVAVDPANDQTILATDSEFNYGASTQGGLLRSTDGGATWSQVLADTTSTNYTQAQVTDVVFDPASPSTVYAALANESGAQSTLTTQGIFKSTDSGATWSLLAGSPTGRDVGNTSLAISQDGVHLYASIADGCFSNQNNCGALLGSSIYELNTSTASWTTINLAGSLLATNYELQYGWQTNNVLAVSPADATGATVLLGHRDLYRSTTSGASWSDLSGSTTSGMATDQNQVYFPSSSSANFYFVTLYGIWQWSGFAQDDNNTLDINAVTGGVYGDAGAYSPLYASIADGTFYGDVQYAAGNMGPSVWNYEAYINNISVDWSNNANIYSSASYCTTNTCTAYQDEVTRSTDANSGGGTYYNDFAPIGPGVSDWGGFFGATVSSVHPQTLFYGTTRVYKTTNSLATTPTWTLISPQLDTTSSGTCTGPTDSNCPFITGVITAPTSDNNLLVTYSDGQTYATTNGGAGWYRTASLCGSQSNCSAYGSYAISPANPTTIYEAANVYSGTGSRSGVWESTNGGYSWSYLNSTASLPASYYSGIAISPANPNLIALTTDAGVLTSYDGGLTWSTITGLPAVALNSAFFSHSGGQMLMTTAGRGVWGVAMPHLTLAPQIVSLTTAPGSSPANQTITLGNSGQGTLTWSTSGLPSWLSVSPSSGSIAANSYQTVTLSFNTPSTTPQTYTTDLYFTGNADNANIPLPVTVSSRLSKTWYFAEGYTGGSFTEYLTLANPNPVTANVSVEYLLQNGSAPITKIYTVNANARQTVEVNTELGIGVGVSMVVTSDQPIIAERPMYFTYSSGGLNVPGGTDVLGATALAKQFDFGYLDTTANHQTYLTVLNQNSSPMTVTVNYYAAGGGAPTTVTHTVPANARGTVLVNTDVPAGSYSAVVTLSDNGLVERPMYLVDGTTGYTGSADVVGVPSATTSWSFAEGFTGSGFSERYILSNPGSVTANITVTFQRADGTTKTQSVSLAADTQQVVDVNSALGAGVGNSATVSSDQPILAERFMSFKYGGTIPGATDVMGATSIGQVYTFAEGYTGNNFYEYLTLQNPQNSTTQVTVEYLPQYGGAPTVQTYFLAANSRYTIYTNQVMVSQSFSMVVLASQPIVAERPMYFAYNGTQTGGSDVVGYQP